VLLDLPEKPLGGWQNFQGLHKFFCDLHHELAIGSGVLVGLEEDFEEEVVCGELLPQGGIDAEHLLESGGGVEEGAVAEVG
jgi:hypothetical protein